MNEILAANAALLLVEKLIPIIAEKVKSGEVGVEEQQLLKARYDSLKARGDEAFAGEHWQVKP